MRNRRLLITLLSGAAALAAAAPASAVVPTTARVSLDSSGAQINSYNALPSVSADGRWVAFDSYSDAVVSGDANGKRDVFLRDRQTGETRRISARPGGGDANGPSAGPSISADGRYVAFLSDATNLSTGTQNATDDVYLYDRVADKLTRLSTSLTGNDGALASKDPQIADDGSTVVFTSDANDLVAGDTGQQDVYAYDVAKGKLTRVSVNKSGTTSNGESYSADVSDGGRYVSFTSLANDLITGDANGFRDIYVRDMVNGTTTRQSVTSAGGEGNNASTRSSISSDGCFVAFNSFATNLASNDDGATRYKVMLRDRCKNTTEIASLTNSGALAETRDGRRPYVSSDGCVVGFVSASLAGGSVWGAFTRDRCKGITSRLDVNNGGEGGNASVDYLQLSPGKGRYAAFDSGAGNLVQGDTNNTYDAFVRDRGDAAPPAADLKLTVDGMRVRADGTGSRDADGSIASARISFGDGTPEDNGLTAAHLYKRGGSFTVTLIVTDDDGLTATTSMPVTVVDSSGGVEPGPVTTPAPKPKPQPKVPSPRTLKLSGGAIVNDRKGVRFSVSSSETSKAKVQIQRRIKRGKKLSWTKVSSLSASLKAGANTVALAKRGALRAGSYRLIATARTKDGRATTKQLIRTFPITKEKS